MKVVFMRILKFWLLSIQIQCYVGVAGFLVSAIMSFSSGDHVAGVFVVACAAASLAVAIGIKKIRRAMKRA